MKRSSTLRSANPLNKLYVIFAVLDEFLVLEGDRHGEKATVMTEFSICIVSRFPYFPLHFKLISTIVSTLFSPDSIKPNRAESFLKSGAVASSGSDLESMVLWWKTDFDDLISQVFNISPKRDELSKRTLFRMEAEPQPIEFLVPEKGMLLFAESLYFFEPLLHCLNFEEFYQVLLCMLLEKTVIFVSTKLQRICSSM